MIELDEINKSLDSLLERSSEVAELDKYIEAREIAGKRIQLNNRLHDAMQKLIAAGKREAARSYTNETHILVFSSFHVIPTRKGVKEGIFQHVDHDVKTLDFVSEFGEKGWNRIDNEEKRIVYLDEFRERCIILLRALPYGALDDQIGEKPENILHKIVGRQGELLQRIGIDPNLGRTVQFFSEILKKISRFKNNKVGTS